MSLRFRIIFGLIIAVFSLDTNAQEIQLIKDNPNNYYSAEGNGITFDEAKAHALSTICNQISVSVTSQIKESDNSSQHGNLSSSDYEQKGSINAVSFASLQNVNLRIITPEPNAKVFCWVSKSDVAKMFKSRAAKIVDMVETGKIAEGHLQIDDALRNYYWALVLAKTCPKAVYADFNGESRNCLTFLPVKIKSVISHLSAYTKDCGNENGKCLAHLQFQYNGSNVATLQVSYFDGQSFVGPETVRDGEGEFDLISMPNNGKMQLKYEYGFREEAENLDPDLKAAFAGNTAPPIDNSFIEIDLSNTSGGIRKKMSKIKTSKNTASNEVVSDIAPEVSDVITREQISEVKEADPYMSILKNVETAITDNVPKSVFQYFTPEGFKMFQELLTVNGKVTLVGKNQKYEFVKAENLTLGRFCKIKCCHKDGKSFMENVVFRFNSQMQIESVAFALTKRAEDDIFNAAAKWPEISRFAILNFMEDYQTAYALKRLDYLKKIFSDDAIIITGAVLKVLKCVTHDTGIEGKTIRFGGKDDETRYTLSTKSQYIDRLSKHFNDREYIHLTYEDNQTSVVKIPALPSGTVFAIQIRQIYNSPVYSDKGYLTLMLDASGVLPIIHVRLWQPDKTKMMDLESFINKFNF